jgi:hypothetical protein
MHTKPLNQTEVGSDQDWHKDGHHVPMRHHMPRWIICFYYPHATWVPLRLRLSLCGLCGARTEGRDTAGNV